LLRSRILWFAERNRPYFLLHPDHLPIFLPWLRACATAREPALQFGILDELLLEREFLELQRYLQGRKWGLQVLKSWNPVDFARAPVALASWDMAGLLLELSGSVDYDLSFKAVGCVEAVERQDLPADCKGRELLDFLISD
jgi:hypothetical protein